MIICDTCGCPVDSESLQLHSDWHDSLVTVQLLGETQPVANPDRIQWVDC